MLKFVTAELTIWT